MSTTVDLAGTDQAIASELGLFSGYDVASADLASRITAALTNAGLTVASVSVAPNLSDFNNYLNGLETTVGLSAGVISWSGSVRVTDDGAPDAIVARVRAAVASVVTSVDSASSGGVVASVGNLFQGLADALGNLGSTAGSLTAGADTIAKVLPWLLIGTAVVFVVVVARNPKAFKAFV